MLCEVVRKYAPQTAAARDLERRKLPPNVLAVPFVGGLASAFMATTIFIGVSVVLPALVTPGSSNVVDALAVLGGLAEAVVVESVILVQVLALIGLAIAEQNLWDYFLVYLDQVGAAFSTLHSGLEPLLLVAEYSPEPITKFGAAAILAGAAFILPPIHGVLSLTTFFAREVTHGAAGEGGNDTQPAAV
jgi:hypothetical protein